MLFRSIFRNVFGSFQLEKSSLLLSVSQEPSLSTVLYPFLRKNRFFLEHQTLINRMTTKTPAKTFQKPKNLQKPLQWPNIFKNCLSRLLKLPKILLNSTESLPQTAKGICKGSKCPNFLNCKRSWKLFWNCGKSFNTAKKLPDSFIRLTVLRIFLNCKRSSFLNLPE